MYLHIARLWLFLALAFLAVSPAHSGSAKKAGIVIEQAWARPSLGSAPNSAAFMSITNKGKADDVLIAARANIAGKVELHQSIMEGNIMRMRRVKGGLRLGAGKSLKLKPGGYHVMLMGLSGKLVDGTSFPMTLVFQHAGDVEITVAISARKPHGIKGDTKPEMMKKMAPRGSM